MYYIIYHKSSKSHSPSGYNNFFYKKIILKLDLSFFFSKSHLIYPHISDNKIHEYMDILYIYIYTVWYVQGRRHSARGEAVAHPRCPCRIAWSDHTARAPSATDTTGITYYLPFIILNTTS